MRRFTLLLCIAWALSSYAAPAPRAGVIQWRDYDAALAEAAHKERLVLVSLYATWCPACKMMTKSTWSSDSVMRAIEASVVPVELNVDAPTPLVICGESRAPAGACATSYWGIQGLPAMLLLDSQGEYLHHESGYFDISMMVNFLEMVQKETPAILKEVRAYRDSLERISQ